MGNKRNPCFTSRNGRLVGREPAGMSLFDFHEAGIRREGKLSAIVRKCQECKGHDAEKVIECTIKDCPLWPYRTGNDPWEIATRLYSLDCELRRGAP